MPPESTSSTTALTPPVIPISSIFSLYASLAVTIPLDPQSGLGGKLLFAGDLDALSRNLLVAANIAGAASLGASSDSAGLRAAMRDGVVDFVVNSLEEALRILKNEIRKRQTVAVGVAIEPQRLMDQMLDRGVLPDLLPPEGWGSGRGQAEVFRSQGAQWVAAAGRGSFVYWTVDRDFARWLPRLDACATQSLPPEDEQRRRWLRLAPRYLGRTAQRARGVAMDPDEELRFRSAVAELMSVDADSPAVQISSEPE